MPATQYNPIPSFESKRPRLQIQNSGFHLDEVDCAAYYCDRIRIVTRYRFR
jgi:hypothetical protein